MAINIIVAYDEGRVIGNGPKIPWRLPEDMAHFKEATDGGFVIMGRKTWESLPKKFRPLPNRTNIVVTRQENWQTDSGPLWTTNGVDAAVTLAVNFILENEMVNTDVWIIGGGEIYRQALELDLVDEIVATEVFGRHEGDVFFPELDKTYWQPYLIKLISGARIVRWKRITPQDYTA